MGEHNYVVYKSTPLGKGIIVAVFVSEFAAKQFISNLLGEYTIAEVEVNSSTSIHNYMNLIKED